MHRKDTAETVVRDRVHAFDLIRGFSVISMVLFHYCYDLRFLAGEPLNFFVSPFIDIWRASISWTFVFVAGSMYSFSHNNLRRAGKYLLVALLIFVATSIAQVDVPINFGIIFCMGACTLTAFFLDKLRVLPRGIVASVLLLLLFLSSLHIPQGYVSLFGLRAFLPQQLYDCGRLSWAGFPGPFFSSGDYYPLLPYVFLYLSANSLTSHAKQTGFPGWFVKIKGAPLEFVGRHALPIYLLHQPVLLLLSIPFMG